MKKKKKRMKIYKRNKISTRFYFRDFDKEMHKIFINDLYDCIQHIQDNEKANNNTFITNTDLTHIRRYYDDNYTICTIRSWYIK